MHIDLMRDKSQALPFPDAPQAVSSLRIWYCKYRTLSELRAFSNLQTLVVAEYPDDTLDVLRDLKHLTYLRIIHLPKVTDLTPVGSLQVLESLSLATLPSWDSSGKVTEIDSLEPLGALPKLRHIELFGIRPTDKSLRPLEKCKGLKSARFSKYPKKEIDRFFETTGVKDDFVPDPPLPTG